MEYLATAEGEAVRLPGVSGSVLPLGRGAVLGAGTMGAGIAMVLAEAGIPVLLKEATEDALARGMGIIRALYANLEGHGKLRAEDVARRMGLITPTLSFEGFGEVDFVIEAAWENLALKQKIFAELEGVCRAGTMLCTNSSTLDLDRIAGACARPERVVGTHFFTPPTKQRLLEIVRGRQTSTEVLLTAMELARQCGKLGVVVGNCRGFVANRMFLPYCMQAQMLVEEGAAVAAVDGTLMGFGMGLGPLAVMDLVGLDVGQLIRAENPEFAQAGHRQPLLEDRLFAAGRLGRKSGAGWHLYDERMHGRPDPEIDEMVREWSVEAGVPQHDVSAAEIVERCMFALVNEGARIVEEGIVVRASSVDVVFVNSFAFPAARGGPMHYADSLGLAHVVARLRAYEAEHGKFWRPAPLLARLAQEGGSFAKYDAEAGG